MLNMAENTERKESSKEKLHRCLEWLQIQNDPDKLKVENDDNKDFNIDGTSQSQKLKLEVDDLASVPAGVDEPAIEPKVVPLRRLRKENLCMQCEWQFCKVYFSHYENFQKHVTKHVSDLHVTETKDGVQYTCLWDVCGHNTCDFPEMVRHINYHAYHAKLLAIGFNGRATLKLQRCLKDSSKRNVLPLLKSEHRCMWVGCSATFVAVQAFFDHVKQHINYSENFLCSWAGCGAVFPRRVFLTMHVRSHTKERLIACFHCGHHFACNRKLSDHLLRQNVDPLTGHACSMCGLACASAYLRQEHERAHVSAYACALCDMSAPSPAALAHHVRYRHLVRDTRAHKCPLCEYRAVTKSDLRKHIPTHTRKKKKIKESNSDVDEEKNLSDEEDKEERVDKKRKVKKYACHLCPEKQVKIFSRGTRLTTHLIKVHGAQWSCGHSRFRYQISEDGMYRLTTTRFEFEDVSKKIVDGYSWPKESLTNNKFEFDLKEIAEATETTPKRFEITLKNNEVEKKSEVNNEVEIMMCDVDEDGNIISTETITDVIYS